MGGSTGAPAVAVAVESANSAARTAAVNFSLRMIDSLYAEICMPSR
jgi:hypothetical protein